MKTSTTQHPSLTAIQPFLNSLPFKLEKDFTFHPPESIQVIGTWAYNAALNNNNNKGKADAIDIALQIPRHCFDDKDQLNHRYHGKRLIYLSYIAHCILASSLLQKEDEEEDEEDEEEEEEEDKLKKKKMVKKDSSSNDTNLQVQSVEWEVLSSNDDARRPVIALHSPRLTIAATTTIEGGKVIDLEGYVIRLVPCIAPDTFPLSKLAPGRNNLRTMTSSSSSSSPSGLGLITTNDQMLLLPTPRYNSTIIQDMLLQYHTTVLKETSSKTCPGFSNAVIMLDIWSRYHLQSNTDSTNSECSDAITGEFLTMLLVHLLHNGQASSAMAPLQLVRCVLVALSNSKKVLGSIQGGLFMKYVPLSSSILANGTGPGNIMSPQPPSAKEWKFLQQQQQQQSQSPPILFIDCSGWYNVASAISRGALLQAQDCAGRTIKLLNTVTPEAFDAVFGRASPTPQLFDYWYKVTIPTSSAVAPTTATLLPPPPPAPTTTGMFSRDVTEWQEQDALVAYHAQRAAGNRATLVRVLHRPATLHRHHEEGKQSPSLPSSSSSQLLPILHHPAPTRRHIILAVRVDPTAVLRTVDRGPPADAKTAAAAFRALWGEKAELRRFQDGSICEAVVWEEGNSMSNNNNNNNGSSSGGGGGGGGRLSRRHTILDQAMSHVLQRHLPKGVEVWSCSDVLDSALQRGIRSKTGDHSVFDNNSMEEDVLAERSCETAVEKLSKQLRSLQSPDDITLRVVSTQPLSSVLRHTAPFPPLPHPLAGGGGGGDSFGATAAAASTVPRCLEAVEIACQLEGSGRWPDSPLAYFKMKAALGVQLAQALRLSYGMEAVASETYVDVLTHGFAFRLLLVAERDEMMSAAAAAASIFITSNSGTTNNDTITNAVEAATMARLIPVRSWHQGAMSSIHAANPAFGPTVRLAKRWIGAHLLSNHFREEAIELLVAYCFTDMTTTTTTTNGGGNNGTTFTTSNKNNNNSRSSSRSNSTTTVPPSPPPSSRLSGFLRFLRLLSDHPWHVDCIIVDPNKELSPNECAAALRRYKLDGITEGGGEGGGGRSRVALGIITPKIATTTTVGGAGGAGGAEEGFKATSTSTSATLSIWSVGRPSIAVMYRAAVLARRSAEALEHMILEDTNVGGGGGNDCTANSVYNTAIIKSVIFSSDLGDYDVIIKIRKDAVTHPDRSLLSSDIPNTMGGGSTSSTSSGGGGALVASSLSSSSVKQNRAVVSGIPISVVNKRGASAVRKELLIGFQPLNIYMDQLEERFGSVAVFCGADCSGGGGGDVVGVKWKSSSSRYNNNNNDNNNNGEEMHHHQQYHAFQPEMAHLVKPVSFNNDDHGGGGKGDGGKKKKKSGGGVNMVVVDVDGIIGEMGEMGAGMVEGIFTV